MNRRQKIIVSVVGIFIVLLALVGITYGYFLTRIQGNTNTTSITVTTADLKLVYGDGTTNVITGNNIIPGNVIGEKDFTVTNAGNDTSYVVTIDGDNDLTNGITPISVTYASNGTTIDGAPYTAGQTTEFESNDFVYTLTCTIESTNTDRNGQNCNGQSLETSFPFNGSVIAGNDIKEGDIHHYVLKVTYKDNGDQSKDMNKTFNAVVNINDIKAINPYKTGVEETDKYNLAYNIINNALINKNGTTLVNTPPTKVAEEISLAEETGQYGFDKETREVRGEISFSEFESIMTETEIRYSDSPETACEGTILTAFDNVLEEKYICLDPGGEYQEILYVFKVDSTSETITIVQESEIIEYEKILSVTNDDYGTSYYFRGNVEDNYVNFAGMCWRIVRIAGDGSIKLILEDQFTTCNDIEDNDKEGDADYKYTGNWGIEYGNYGYESKNVDNYSDKESIMNYLNPSVASNTSMVKAFYDFQTTGKLKDYVGKLKAGGWCLADKAYTQSGSSPNYTYTLLEEYNYSSSMYYDSYVRLFGDNTDGYQPTLKCTGTTINKFESVTNSETEIIKEVPMYISTLTADEIIYAGVSIKKNNSYYYLMNEWFESNSDVDGFWTLTPSNFKSIDNAFFVTNAGSLYYRSVVESYPDKKYRPAVSLAIGSVITEGNGTQEKPYVIG